MGVLTETQTGIGKWLAVVSFCCLGLEAVVSDELPQGYWDLAQTQAILDKTLTIKLGPDLTTLTADERAALHHLLEAGRVLHALYEQQKHAEAASARSALKTLRRQLDSRETNNLWTLYALFEGPIATTLYNQRVPFLPVGPEQPGRNVYPGGVTRIEIEQFLGRHPELSGSILDGRTVVRRATSERLHHDLQTLAKHPVLGALHPGLQDRLKSIEPDEGAFYSVPYSVAYANSLAEVHQRLWRVAELMADTDPDFAAYLRLRARDLLADDYEGGDAAWVTGRFANLNAQIGSYETYDDKLFGVKTFFSLSVLLRDRERSEQLATALADIQAIEDSLPYEFHKRVRSEIPVGVYHVIADFGQSRGGNTATILPNDADHARKYGRTILLRYNIMTDPERFEVYKARFAAATDPAFHDDLTIEAMFHRTLWHEIGHYLGVDQTEDGRDLDTALAEFSDLLEELKSDLVATYSADGLHRAGYYTDEALRAVYAGGVLRVLQPVKPRLEQPYQTMQLMQWNYFLENGVLRLGEQTGTLEIDYSVYHRVVAELLREVLALQRAGDPRLASEFVERWGYWQDNLHEVVATRIRDAEQYRYTLVRYSVLEDE